MGADLQWDIGRVGMIRRWTSWLLPLAECTYLNDGTPHWTGGSETNRQSLFAKYVDARPEIHRPRQTEPSWKVAALFVPTWQPRLIERYLWQSHVDLYLRPGIRCVVLSLFHYVDQIRHITGYSDSGDGRPAAMENRISQRHHLQSEQNFQTKIGSIHGTFQVFGPCLSNVPALINSM